MPLHYPVFCARMRSLGKAPDEIRRRLRDNHQARHAKAVRQCNRWMADRISMIRHYQRTSA